MRTAVRIDDALLAKAKRRAVESGTTLTAVIEDALREALARRREDDRQLVRLTTVSGRGICSGVDLDDTSTLVDFMERAGDPV
jgi:hypothetical protein